MKTLKPSSPPASVFARSRLVVPLIAFFLLANGQTLVQAQVRGKTPEVPASRSPETPTGDAGAALTNPLHVGTLVEFDASARTVGDAITSILAPVRYRVTSRTVDANVTASVLGRPLPAAARAAGVMSVESALLLLIGDENRLVFDHRNRLIAIERIAQDSTAAKDRAGAAPPSQFAPGD